MASTTTRLDLSYPSGTDAESAFVALDQSDMATLDDAAIWQASGTLASKPAATSVPVGSFYMCTDTSALLVCINTGAGNFWYWPFAAAEPIGTTKQFAGSTVPSDPDGVARWHLCDGTAISRTANAALFTVIGTTYGTGDGSTTFNLPDAHGKFPLGGPDGTGFLLGNTGGSLNHTHTVPGLSVPGLSVPALSVPGLSIPVLSVNGASIPSLSIPSLFVNEHSHGLSNNGGAQIFVDAPIFGDLAVWTGAGGPNFTTGALLSAQNGAIGTQVTTFGSTALVGNTDSSGATTEASGTFPGTTAATTTAASTTGGASTGTGTTGGGTTGTGTSGANNPSYLVLNTIIKIA